MIIYVAHHHDRHIDEGIYLFSTESAAREKVATILAERLEHWEGMPTEEYPIDDVLYHCEYGAEGDYVQVYSRELDA